MFISFMTLKHIVEVRQIVHETSMKNFFVEETTFTSETKTMMSLSFFDLLLRDNKKDVTNKSNHKFESWA